ncbi:MAG: fimbria/pilus outer membrane usher protein [Plesiomonas shigelloides]
MMGCCRIFKKSFNMCFLSVLTVACLPKKSLAIEFNTDMLDGVDEQNVDFTKFSSPNYLLPGTYQFSVYVNGKNITPESQNFIVKDSLHKDGSAYSYVCLSSDLVSQIGFSPAALETLGDYKNDECITLSSLNGVQVSPNISNGQLNIVVPKSLLEYTSDNWEPISRWDDGIPGIIADYNINTNAIRDEQNNKTATVSYNGVVGANYGAWRVRSEYQGVYSKGVDDSQNFDTGLSWNRFYAYRALPKWKSDLVIGENIAQSDVFDSWDFTGLALASDRRMIPPNLRGYAPEITGVAETNARVVISQQGRILYDSTVPAGPFSIQSLDSSIRGTVNVKIVEQNGTVKTYNIETAYVPFLTRPGQVRHKLFIGQSRVNAHSLVGPKFISGELSFGLNNQVSLYGGVIFSNEYNSAALGLGSDFGKFGAMSADITHSRYESIIPDDDNAVLGGSSFRLSYSKSLESIDADLTFAGYKFSQKTFMTMSQYVNSSISNVAPAMTKEMYTLSVNKNLKQLQSSLNLQYNQQSYWNQAPSSTYSVSLNRYFDFFDFKGVSLGVSLSRAQYQNMNGANEGYNDTAYVNFSLPLSSGFLNYAVSGDGKSLNNTIGYSSGFVNKSIDNYTLTAGLNKKRDGETEGLFNGYFSKRTPWTSVSGSVGYQDNGYTSLGLSLNGGVTMTAKGAAFHGGNKAGGERLMIDTDGVAGVPLDLGRVVTNRFGIGVDTDVSAYNLDYVAVDVNALPKDIQANKSVVSTFLTGGAIGYRKLDVLRGTQVFGVISLRNNKPAMFGSTVINDSGKEVGMVGDDGMVWLAGVKPNEKLTVRISKDNTCKVKLPESIITNNSYLLPCE